MGSHCPYMASVPVSNAIGVGGMDGLCPCMESGPVSNAFGVGGMDSLCPYMEALTCSHQTSFYDSQEGQYLTAEPLP